MYHSAFLTARSLIVRLLNNNKEGQYFNNLVLGISINLTIYINSCYFIWTVVKVIVMDLRAILQHAKSHVHIVTCTCTHCDMSHILVKNNIVLVFCKGLDFKELSLIVMLFLLDHWARVVYKTELYRLLQMKSIKII